VDRILRQQKAEKLAAEEALRKEASEKEKQLVSDKHPIAAAPTGPLPNTIAPQVSAPESEDAHEGDLKALLPAASESSKRNSRPQSMINSLQKWGRKLTPRAEHDASETSESSSSLAGLRPDTPHDVVRSSSPRPGVTPLSNIGLFFALGSVGSASCLTILIIAANINTAVQACRQEQGNVLHNREQMQLVKESLEEGYCDVSGRADDLTHIGMYFSVLRDTLLLNLYYRRHGRHQNICISKLVYTAKSYLALIFHLVPGIPDPASLMRTKKESIARFIHVINPLRDVYNLPQRSLHIFHDTAGDLIAFNRNASLFLNLRFFEAWREF
jgi:hypothetical protein